MGHFVLWYCKTKQDKQEAVYQTKEHVPILIGERSGILGHFHRRDLGSRSPRRGLGAWI